MKGGGSQVPTYIVVSPDGVPHVLVGVGASTALWVRRADGGRVSQPHGTALTVSHGDTVVSHLPVDHPLLVEDASPATSPPHPPVRQRRRRGSTETPDAKERQ
jgi:hypothetical protein